MPEILATTNPVPGYDKNSINRNTPVAPEKVQIQNSPDLTRVSHADGRTEWQDSNLQGDGRVRYDSNFQTFMQRLQNTPGVTESLAKIFTIKDGVIVASGMAEDTAKEMARLMSMLKMDEQELMKFLAGQMKSGSRLNGALFALLRNAYGNAESEAVRKDILQFLKTYLDYSSSSHVEGNILRNLGTMADAMPASWAEQLKGVLEQLYQAISSGDRQGTLQLLQRGILPYIARYIEQTHDMGLPRDLVSLLALDVARYENGTQENLLSAFRQLAGYGTLKGMLGNIDDQSLLQILNRNEPSANSAAIQFANQLANLAAKGLRGNGGPEIQQAYQNLIQAMLLNESVYMPLNHYMLPLQWDGKLMFSELWVDPNAEDEQSGAQSGKRGKSFKVLMKIDIENLGLLDVIVHNKDDSVDIQISGPAVISAFSKQIEKGISDILTRNELKLKKYISEMKR